VPARIASTIQNNSGVSLDGELYLPAERVQGNIPVIGNSGDSFLAVPLHADGLVTVLGELARCAICKFDSLKSTFDVGPRLRAPLRNHDASCRSVVVARLTRIKYLVDSKPTSCTL
jgi:hypothetical protein